MNKLEKLKMVALAIKSEPILDWDDRTYEEVLADITKVFSSDTKFIDGAYAAIMAGKAIVFSYDPDESVYGYLSGPDRQTILNAMKAIADGKSELYDGRKLH